MLKKILALLVFACIATLLLASCGRGADEASVYYLNFKPEQDVQWKALAKEYTDKTGIPVTVVTAASAGAARGVSMKIWQEAQMESRQTAI